MLSEAEKVADGKCNFESYEDVIGTEK
jgi:hypothetical protein